MQINTQYSLLQPHFRSAFLRLQKKLRFSKERLGDYLENSEGVNLSELIRAISGQFMFNVCPINERSEFIKDPQYLILRELIQKNDLSNILNRRFLEQNSKEPLKANSLKRHDKFFKKFAAHKARGGVSFLRKFCVHFFLTLFGLFVSSFVAACMTFVVIAFIYVCVATTTNNVLLEQVTHNEDINNNLIKFLENIKTPLLVISVASMIVAVVFFVFIIYIPVARHHFATYYINNDFLREFNAAIEEWLQSYSAASVKLCEIANNVEDFGKKLVKNRVSEEDVENLLANISDLENEISKNCMRDVENIKMLKARANRFFAIWAEAEQVRQFVDDAPMPVNEKDKTHEKPKRNSDGIFELGRAVAGSTVSSHKSEARRIFTETQAKRLKHWVLKFIGAKELAKKYAYFSKDEDRNGLVYKYDKPCAESQELRVQHLSHACELIQVNNLNILTDPVFGDLSAALYPAQTRSGLDEEEIPPVDVILISHNHRDHMDFSTLRKFLKHQPLIVVPEGDIKKIEKLGFRNVVMLSWGRCLTLKTEKIRLAEIIATPADHWSGRGLCDAGKSATNGYLVKAPRDERLDNDSVVYFAGDTAKLTVERFDHVVSLIEGDGSRKVETLVNLEPGGPNYSRADMQSTHQSIVDSVITHFKFKFNQRLPRCKVQTSIMHHNKYMLGVDRFDENLEIFREIYNFFDSARMQGGVTDIKALKNIANRGIEQADEKHKFIYKGIVELLLITEEFMRNAAPSLEDKEFLIQVLQVIQQNLDEIMFPLIGEAFIGPQQDKARWVEREKLRELLGNSENLAPGLQ